MSVHGSATYVLSLSLMFITPANSELHRTTVFQGFDAGIEGIIARERTTQYIYQRRHARIQTPYF
jgi:hypothetical protein